ncbi:MAG: Trk system potassium transporter TrkA [Clostridia bacterium]|nr:Trk system potassium transporter TrkA [Clostridia bacterium]
MKIIIIGCGTVGAGICSQIAPEGHDITVIDDREQAVSDISNTCDVIGVVGSGIDISVLRKAGADKADLVISVTPNDEVNLLSCLAARKLGARNTIARVGNPDYAEMLQLIKQDLHLSMTVNPELAAAKKIYRMLRYPSAAKVETFYRGKVELVEFAVTANSPFCNKSLFDLRSALKMTFLVCGVLRDGEMFIPSGHFVLKEGDVIGVTAPDEELTSLFKAAKMFKQPAKNILIVGGGAITYHLEGMLKQSKIHSTIIESEKSRCYELTDTYGSTVVCDDGTKQEVLLSEGIEHTDAFLALADKDEQNVIMAMYARTKKVPKIITLIHKLSYVDFFASGDLQSIVTPKSITATDILQYVRALSDDADSEIETLHKIMDGHAEAIEFSIKQEIEGVTDIPLKDLRPRSGILIACLIRGRKVIIPSGLDAIRKGDTVLIVTTSDKQLTNIKDIVK